MYTVARLREILAGDRIAVAPCVPDALSARLVEEAGLPIAFMGGFGVAATQWGLPDTGLIGYHEMVEQARRLCAAVTIPVIGDGDTGYGNAINVKRTVDGYAAAGLACIMIEDQVWPKRCGHTAGKSVVSRGEALARIKAAVDARDEGADILIMARTDARVESLDEAIWRGKAFADLGVDVVFCEAPRSLHELERVTREIPGPQMANMLEQGDTPILPPSTLEALGFRIVAYPITVLAASIFAVRRALAALAEGRVPEALVDFADLRELVGFGRYDAARQIYARFEGEGAGS
jgi:2-methylisocitrate lyase-like PEP mutase family enzyme